MKSLLVLSLIGGLLFCETQLSTLRINEDVKRAESVEIDIEFGLGEIHLSPGSGKEVVKGNITYNEKLCDIEYSYQESGSKGIFNLEVDWDSKRHNDNDDDDLDCVLEVTRDIPVDLKVELGLGEGIFDLNRLRVHSLDIECGLGEAEIDFGSKGNRTTCEYVDIETGLGSVKMKNIANANAKRMDFSCGLGSMDLEFTGELKSDTYIDVAVGLGSADLLIPYGTNVVFEYDYSLFSSVDLHDFEKIGNDEYRSKIYREGNPTIYFSASVGMGSIDFRWLD